MRFKWSLLSFLFLGQFAGCALEEAVESEEGSLHLGSADGFVDEDNNLSDYLNEPPEGFSNIVDVVPSVLVDIRYHGLNNFTKAPLPGYGAPGLWLRDDAAHALARVQDELALQGLTLLVYDAYRPQRATLAMVAWARRTEQEHLLGEYIAEVSSHNHGGAIDLTLAQIDDGIPLEMGTEFDAFDERSHTWGVRADEAVELENRLTLRNVMERHGFRPYNGEWWHFRYPLSTTTPRDVPYSCYEPAEGEWLPPEGWDEPGFEMPTFWSPLACGDDVN